MGVYWYGSVCGGVVVKQSVVCSVYSTTFIHFIKKVVVPLVDDNVT